MKVIDIPTVTVENKLLMYRRYINTLLPMLNKRAGTRGSDILAAILCYTNKVKDGCKDIEELAARLATQEARDTIRGYIPDMYSDKKQKMKSTMEADYFNMVTTLLRKDGYFFKSKNENKRYKSLLLKRCKIFDIAFLDLDEIQVVTTIKISKDVI